MNDIMAYGIAFFAALGIFTAMAGVTYLIVKIIDWINEVNRTMREVKFLIDEYDKLRYRLNELKERGVR